MRRWQVWVCVVLASFLTLGAAYATTSWFLGRPPEDEPALADPVLPGTTILPPHSDEIVIHATGDVNLDPDEIRSGDPWGGVRSLLSSDDLSIVNLECAAGVGGTEQDKQYTFRCDTARYPAMRAAGVEVANQANNHSEDFGPLPMLDGKMRLEHAGIGVVGAGRDLAEATKPSVFVRRTKRVAVVAFSGVVPERSWFAGMDHPGLANGYDSTSMAGVVRAVRAEADVVIVVIHWGIERATVPLDSQVFRAHALIDAGADMIFGHHPHVVQPLEWYKGRPIFYSLGNFVWPVPGSTAIAEVRVPTHGTIQACLLPALISNGRPALTGPTRCAS